MILQVICHNKRGVKNTFVAFTIIKDIYVNIGVSIAVFHCLHDVCNIEKIEIERKKSIVWRVFGFPSDFEISVVAVKWYDRYCSGVDLAVPDIYLAVAEIWMDKDDRHLF